MDKLYQRLIYENVKRDAVIKYKPAYWKTDLVQIDREIERIKNEIKQKEQKENESIKDSEFFGFM